MAAIEEFCRDFGLDPEFSMHSNIRGLSGGQKVKLVLAAAMWSNPHMLIMDEPVRACGGASACIIGCLHFGPVCAPARERIFQLHFLL